MIIRMRPYAGPADRDRMLALAHTFPAGRVHLADLPYRLASWACDYPQNVGLWEDGQGQLLAWAVLNTPFWALDYAYGPAARDYGILPQILTWARRRATESAGAPNGRPCWFAAAFADQTDQLGDLERAGFARQDTAANPYAHLYMVRPGQAPVHPAALPEGFRIRPLAGPAEVEAAAALHRAAFDSPNMTAAWRSRILEAPAYRPDLDLVVEVAPAGRLVAFCVGWLHADADDHIGQIEPLGVHPDFRRQGLGGAVLAELLRRLAGYGVTQMVVETDDFRDAAFRLYVASGFQMAQPIVVCRADFAPSG